MASLTRTCLSTEPNEMMDQPVWVSVERIFQAKGTECAKALWQPVRTVMAPVKGCTRDQ